MPVIDFSRFRFALVILSLVFGQYLSGQSNPNFSSFCEGASTICEVTSELLNNTYRLPDSSEYDQNILDAIPSCVANGFTFGIQNPYWISFIATSNTISFDMVVDNCTMDGNGDMGIQYAFVSDCTTLEHVDCESGLQFGNVSYTGSNFEIGKEYFLILDGFGGIVCDFRFTGTTGMGTYLLDNVMGIQISEFPNDSICLGAEQVLLEMMYNPGTTNENADSTHWVVTNTLDGSVAYDTAVQGLDILLDFTSVGQYDIELTAFNACDSSQSFIKTIEVYEQENIVLDLFQFCEEDFPVTPTDPLWEGGTLTSLASPAIHTIVTYPGCTYEQQLPLDPLKSGERAMVDTMVCGFIFDYHGNTITQDGSIDLALDNLAANGCDSLVTLRTEFLNFAASMRVEQCTNRSFHIAVEWDESNIWEDYSNISYDWHFDGGTSLTDNNGLDSVLVTDLTGLLVVEVTFDKNNRTCTQLMSVDVEEQNRDNNLICTGETNTTLKIEWDANPIPRGYELYLDGVLEVSYENQFTDYEYTIQGLSPGVGYDIRLRSLYDNCPPSIERIQCAIQGCPDITVEAAFQDSSVCLGSGIEEVFFGADAIGGNSTGTWTWESDNGGIIDPDTGIFDVVGSGAGPYMITIRYTEGICVFDTTARLTINNVTNSEFTMPDTICIENEAIVLIGSSVDLGENFAWDISDGGVLTDLGADMVSIKWDTPGDKTVSLVVGEAPCQSEPFSLPIHVEDLLPSPDIECNATLNSISITWDAIPCAVDYEVFVDDVLVSTQSILFYEMQGLDQGQEIEFVVRPDSQCACPSTSDTISCIVQSCPDISVAIDPMQDVCLGRESTSHVFLSSLSNGTNTGEINWIVDGIAYVESVDLQQVGLGSHQLILAYTEGSCEYRDTSFFNVYSDVEAAFDVTQAVCGDEVFGGIDVNVLGGTAPFELSLNNDIQSDFSLSNLTFGSYFIEIEDLNGCSLDTTITLDPPPGINGILDGPLVLYDSIPSRFNIVSSFPKNFIDSISWTFNGDRLCLQDCSETIDLAIQKDGELCAEVYYNGSCMEQICNDLEHERIVRVYIPDAVLSGGTDVNSKWKIFSSDTTLLIQSVEIFDRWGSRVHFQENVAVDKVEWSGNIKGSSDMIRPGVYAYRIVFIDERNMLKNRLGQITVLR